MNKGATKLRELIFIILIPVGVFLFSVLTDYFNNIYWQKKLDSATEYILADALKAESVVTVEDYLSFTEHRYEYEKLPTDDIKVTFLNDEHNSVLLSITIEHFSIYGYVTGQKQYTTSRYEGYLDEYNEANVKKLVEVFSDDKVDEGKE